MQLCKLEETNSKDIQTLMPKGTKTFMKLNLSQGQYTSNVKSVLHKYNKYFKEGQNHQK